MSFSRTSRVLTIAEDNTRASANGLDVKVRRSPQAVACRKRYVVELGRPQKLRDVGEVYMQDIRLMRHEKGNQDTGLCRNLNTYM